VSKLRRLWQSARGVAGVERLGDGPRRPLPTFQEASTRRQRARSAGLDPDYWYPVEYDRAVGKGEVREIAFWSKTYALYRDAEGALHVVENRCAHRQLRLTEGDVRGCNLVCAYHGWQYDGTGRLVAVDHELFGRPLPRVKIASYPVEVRYGLIWVFFGDPARSAERAIPDIPELTGQSPWPCVPIDFVWRAHHSMIIDNVSDFTHAYLHRKYQPFKEAKLIDCRTEGDKVVVSYEAKIGQGPVYRLVVDHAATDTSKMELCYEYPFQWSNTDNRIKHHCFVLPIDRTTTRTFFLFYYDPRVFKLPHLPVAMPKRWLRPLLQIANAVLVGPLLEQDGFAVEEEQRAYERHFDAPQVELNPAITAFQDLTAKKWEQYLAGRAVERTQAAMIPASLVRT
jgi:4beta-methylsterol monooxygenase